VYFFQDSKPCQEFSVEVYLVHICAALRLPGKHLFATMLRLAFSLAFVFALIAADGVTLKVYKNMALHGTPASTKVINTTSFSLPATKEPFSAEMTGTLSFPPTGGVYHFDCKWTESTLGYVWVDGHMVCQDGKSYQPDPGDTDNPLPINTFKRSKGVISSLPFRAHFYYNGKGSTSCVGSSVGVYNDSQHQCGFTQLGNEGTFLTTNSWETAATACNAAGKPVAGASAGKGEQVWCGESLTPNCPRFDSYKSKKCPGNSSETCGDSWVLEVIKYDCRPIAAASAGLSVQWASLNVAVVAGVAVVAVVAVALTVAVALALLALMILPPPIISTEYTTAATSTDLHSCSRTAAITSATRSADRVVREGGVAADRCMCAFNHPERESGAHGRGLRWWCWWWWWCWCTCSAIDGGGAINTE
jgi:hypothetical protein